MTQPIDLRDLDALIRFHQDSVWSHKYQMAPATLHLKEQTIKCLKHYRHLLSDEPIERPDPYG